MCHCNQCGYEWKPRPATVGEPKACPNCKRYDWNQPNKGGAVAQVVERLPRKQKVAGSMPAGTSKTAGCPEHGVGCGYAKAGGWSKRPIVEMLIPSTLDDSLAPQGQHVASLFCQHVAPELPDGKSWEEHRDEVADLMISTVDRHAPGFAASVLGRKALSPLDLERDFGLLGGDIFHGKSLQRFSSGSGMEEISFVWGGVGSPA